MRSLKPLSEWTPNPRPGDDASVFQEHRSWLQLRVVLLICKITPDCPEVARLLSLGMDRPLPLTIAVSAMSWNHERLSPVREA